MSAAAIFLFLFSFALSVEGSSSDYRLRKVGDDMLLKCVNTGSQNKLPNNISKRDNSYVLRKTINGKRFCFRSTDIEYIKNCMVQLNNGIIPKKRQKGVKYSEEELNSLYMDKTEKWKWIPGYEGLYAISDYGNVVSFSKNINGKPISTNNKNGWYLSFRASDKDGKISTIRIHQAVLKAFIGECPDGYEIHHKDGNKQNNRIENLEYITPKEHGKRTLEQNPHMYDGMIAHNKSRYTGKYKIRTRNRTPRARFQKGDILQYTLNGEFLNRFKNAKDAERKTGVCSRNILQVANKTPFNNKGGTRKQAGGYSWIFEVDINDS